MAVGGKREGAGRKKGGKNTRTREIAMALKKQGITPLEYMLKIMRDTKQPADRRDDMARASAKFIHPTLQAVEMSGGVTVKHEDAIAALK